MIATIDIGSIVLPTAPIGPCSPLPLLDSPTKPADIVDDVPADIAARARQGAPPTLLPYQAQDDYGRDLSPRLLRVAVLENDVVRATVALDLGGRLLSLHDRRADRPLLYTNPVLQPANLALRNAWFSGGVEWNIGTRGHSPTTMDTLHAARVDGPRGEPMLRLWEWERIRNVVFQVDLWLPEAAPVLLASTRIRNVNDLPTPMYWWTNAAVAVRPDTRVLAPAVRAFRTEYPNRLGVAAIPGDGGNDVTFPPATPMPPTSSSTSGRTSARGSPPSTATGQGSPTSRRPGCAVGSSSSGEPGAAEGAGSSGCPTAVARSTPRSRPVSPRPSSSTSRCRPAPSGAGQKCSARSPLTPTTPTGRRGRKR